MNEVFVTGPGWLNLIIVGILFGFGFAIGGWLWSAILAAIQRATHKSPPATP